MYWVIVWKEQKKESMTESGVCLYMQAQEMRKGLSGDLWCGRCIGLDSGKWTTEGGKGSKCWSVGIPSRLGAGVVCCR